MMVAIPASTLAIGSWLALIPAVGFWFVIVRRAQLEEEFLRRNLVSYVDYMRRVRGGLLPCLPAFSGLHIRRIGKSCQLCSHIGKIYSYLKATIGSILAARCAGM